MGGPNTSTGGGTSWAGDLAKNFFPEQFQNRIGADLQSLYNKDPQSGVFQGSLYSPMGSGTTKALAGLDSVALSNAGRLNGAYGTVGNIMNNPLSGKQNSAMTSALDVAKHPLTAGQQGAIGQTNQIAGDYRTLANSMKTPGAYEKLYGNLYNDAGQQSMAERSLMDAAEGRLFGTNAPGYATLRENAINDAVTAANAGYAASGRLGSGLNLQSAARGAADAAAGLDYTNYQNDIARQERAVGAVDAARNNRIGMQANIAGAGDASERARQSLMLSALGGAGTASGNAFNMLQQGTANKLNAASSVFGMGQQGIGNQMSAAGMIPSLYNATLSPYQTMLGTGQLRDQNAQGILTGQNDLFLRQRDAGFNNIAKTMSLFTGFNPQQQQSNPFFDAISGLGTVASLFL